MNIKRLPFSLDVGRLQAELAAHPEVWGQHRWRTEGSSPHRECSDVWVRYNALENFGPHFNDEHESEWYPVADVLPAAVHLTNQIYTLVDGSELGGVLITKVPAGKQVHPHTDRGWHAEHYEKFAVLIAGNPEQKFCFRDGAMGCSRGDCFWFRNDVPHWVLNPTAEDRITLIVCARIH